LPRQPGGSPASEAIFILDARNGRIVDANRKAEELMAAPVKNLLGAVLRLTTIGSGPGREYLPPELSANIGANREAELQSALGSRIHVEFSGSLVEIRSGALIELIVRDVREQKRAAAQMRASEQRYRKLSEELRIARDTALEAIQTKGQFLANMSHEIRTPMNGVVGMLSLALESCTEGEQRDQLQIAQSAAKSLVTILNDILDLSKIEAGKMAFESIDFDLRKLLTECLGLFQIPAREKNLGLDLSFDPNCPAWVRGDPVRLRQMLVNLIGNAVKFTINGSVLVSGSSPQPGIVRLEVRDTGIGIAPDKLQSIFDPFTQADSSHARQFGGTGLGLTITRRLSNLMGGRMWVESQVGQGSSFGLELPFQKAMPGTAKPSSVESSGAQPSLASIRILVAEDNIVNQKVITAMLRRQGCIVTLAPDGREAHALFLKDNFDLILMDVQMPGMDGLEATRLIREEESRRFVRSGSRRVPILALTAHALQAQQDQCLAAGMDAVITKPVDLASLVNSIQQALNASPVPASVEVET
jgi:signal transduction histidine kinase/CheY-like chemotaxis protein